MPSSGGGKVNPSHLLLRGTNSDQRGINLATMPPFRDSGGYLCTCDETGCQPEFVMDVTTGSPSPFGPARKWSGLPDHRAPQQAGAEGRQQHRTSRQRPLSRTP